MKNPTTVQFIFALMVLVGAAGAYIFVFNETRHLQQDIVETSLAIAQKTALQREAMQSKDNLSKLEADETQVARHFIDTEGIVEFLESIETIGAEFGADVAVVSVGDPVEGRVTLALSIIGTFDAVMKTVARIEYGAYASATKSLTLDVADDGLWSAALTFSVMTDTTP